MLSELSSLPVFHNCLFIWTHHQPGPNLGSPSYEYSLFSGVREDSFLRIDFLSRWLTTGVLRVMLWLNGMSVCHWPIYKRNFCVTKTWSYTFELRVLWSCPECKMSMFQLTYLFEGVSKSFSPTRKLAWLRLSSTFPWVWPDLVFFLCLVSFQFLCEFLKHFLHFSLLAKAYFISYSELSLMKAAKILPSYHEISQQSTISPGNQ